MTGLTGVFPANYIEKTKESDVWPLHRWVVVIVTHSTVVHLIMLVPTVREADDTQIRWRMSGIGPSLGAPFDGVGKGTLGVLGRELMKGLGRELWVC